MASSDRRGELELFKDEIEVIDRPVASELGASMALRKDLARPCLFTNVDGKGLRLIGNLWATRPRIARALGTKVEDIPRFLLEAIRRPQACTFGKAPFLKNGTRKVDLTALPIPKFFKKDGGRYFTSAMVVAHDAKGNRNVSYHRMMVLGPNKVVARIVERHLFSMYEEAMKAKKDLKVSIFMTLEIEPMLCGAMSVNYGTDEFTIASALKRVSSKKPLRLVKLSNSIPVPASSQYAFEGRITSEKALEGPFVDITGTYDEVRMQPVFVLDKMYSAPEPVFHSIMPGGLDHFLMMGMPREPVILDAVEKAVPHVGSIRLTEGGCSWFHSVVSIKQQKQGDAKNAILAALGSHPSMKRVIVVDTDIDIFNDREVEWALATRFQADEDLIIIPEARGSTLDSSANGGVTHKVGIDATYPHGRAEEFMRVKE
jgi:UbiD family decarboxylase